MYGNRGFQRVAPPVREGEEIDVTIEAVGEKGDGIAKVRNFVIFVPNTKQGDTVRVRITKVLKRVGFAEVIGEAKEVEAKADPIPTKTELRQLLADDTRALAFKVREDGCPMKPEMLAVFNEFDDETSRGVVFKALWEYDGHDD